MLKVIHVITDMKIGGAGKWLLNFLRNYDREAISIKVVVPKGSVLKAEIEMLRIPVVEIAGIGDKSLDIFSISAMLSLFKQERPQIVHTHASLSARIAARLAGVKAIIHTKHCLDQPKTGWKKTAASILNNQFSNWVIAVSEAVEKNLLEAGTPKQKIRMIYGAVDELKSFDGQAIREIRGSYGLSEKDIVFGMVARLAEVKGHSYLLKAAELVGQKRSDIKFIIAGTGPLEEKLKETAMQKGLDKTVVFTGFIKDVERIYNIIDVNMITSKSEAQCLALVEGMSLGKPMIGTAVGGVPELIIPGETGLLVPPAQSQALAEAILELGDNAELRNAMGRKAREMMLERFSASKMAEEILKLYAEAVK